MYFNPHPEMGLNFTMPLLKVSHTLLTPPDSPQGLSKASKRHPSRFRLPKILRRTRTVDLINPLRVSAGLHKPPNRSTTHECSKQEEPNVTTSPALPETTLPLSLILPVGSRPRLTDGSLIRIASRRLRRMPKSHHDLRASKSDNQLSLLPMSPDMKVAALLPSPLFSGPDGGQARNECFTFQDLMGQGGADANDYEEIIADYCEDVFGKDRHASKSVSAINAPECGNQSASPKRQPHGQLFAVSQTSPVSKISVNLRSPKRERSSSLSSEATWLSKSFADQDYSTCMGQVERIKVNERRLTEKSRRCCHLVQGPSDDLADPWKGDGKTVGYSLA